MYPGISYKHLWHGLIFVSEISINENKWQYREMSLPKLSKFDLLPSMLLNRADGIFFNSGLLFRKQGCICFLASCLARESAFSFPK